MAKCNSYNDWEKVAFQFDKVEDIKNWKEKTPSKYYDFKYIHYLRNQLIDARQK